jgi:hypothetical protein
LACVFAHHETEADEDRTLARRQVGRCVLDAGLDASHTQQSYFAARFIIG